MKFLMLFEEYSSYQTKVLDDLLDKISKSGIDSLSPEERKQLKNIDDVKSPEVQKLLKNDDVETEPSKASTFDVKNIINKKYFDSTKEICFLLKNIDDTDEYGVLYMGDIYFRYKVYHGYIVKVKETESADYNFISDNSEIFEPSEYDLHYEFDGLIEEVFYDENINKNLLN
jgi:hypothetical protein